MLALWIIVAMPTGAFTPYDENGNVTPHGRLAARLVYVVLTVGYFWIGESLGQTVGKRVVGIRVVTAHDWGRPGVYRGLARVLLGGVSLLALGTGFALIPFDREGRAFHDRVTGTRVVER